MLRNTVSWHTWASHLRSRAEIKIFFTNFLITPSSQSSNTNFITLGSFPYCEPLRDPSFPCCPGLYQATSSSLTSTFCILPSVYNFIIIHHFPRCLKWGYTMLTHEVICLVLGCPVRHHLFYLAFWSRIIM